MKWGEYSSDVQFVLQRSDQPSANNLKSPPVNDIKAALAARNAQKKLQSTSAATATAMAATVATPMDSKDACDVIGNQHSIG